MPLNLHEIVFGGGGAILIILTLVQIAPIKISPWSALAKAIGKAVNGELIEKIDNLDHEVKDLRNVCDERDATLMRTHILHFNDELLHDKSHTKEHFDQILDDITSYEKYCNGHPDYKNKKAECAIGNIRRTYDKCMEEHKFL